MCATTAQQCPCAARRSRSAAHKQRSSLDGVAVRPLLLAQADHHVHEAAVVLGGAGSAPEAEQWRGLGLDAIWAHALAGACRRGPSGSSSSPALTEGGCASAPLQRWAIQLILVQRLPAARPPPNRTCLLRHLGRLAANLARACERAVNLPHGCWGAEEASIQVADPARRHKQAGGQTRQHTCGGRRERTASAPPPDRAPDRRLPPARRTAPQGVPPCHVTVPQLTAARRPHSPWPSWSALALARCRGCWRGCAARH